MADSEFQADPPEEKPKNVRRGKPLPPPDEDEGDYDEPERFRRKDAVESLIPYKNPLGLTAYYVGVFALIPCAGLVLGPAAFILGIMGLRYGKKHPTAGGAGHAIAGIVLGALVTLGHLAAVVFIVVMSILNK
jgi:hypothetical protein